VRERLGQAVFAAIVRRVCAMDSSDGMARTIGSNWTFLSYLRDFALFSVA